MPQYFIDISGMMQTVLAKDCLQFQVCKLAYAEIRVALIAVAAELPYVTHPYLNYQVLIYW